MNIVQLFRSTLYSDSLVEAQEILLKNMPDPPSCPDLARIETFYQRFEQCLQYYNDSYAALPRFESKNEVDHLLDLKRRAQQLHRVVEMRTRVLAEIKDLTVFGPFEKLVAAVGAEFAGLAAAHVQYIENLRSLDVSGLGLVSSPEIKDFDAGRNRILAKYYIINNIKSDSTILRAALKAEICAKPGAFLSNLREIPRLFACQRTEIQHLYDACFAQLLPERQSLREVLVFLAHFERGFVDDANENAIKQHVYGILLRGAATFEYVAACPDAVQRAFRAERDNLVLRYRTDDVAKDALTALTMMLEIVVDAASDIIYATIGVSAAEITQTIRAHAEGKEITLDLVLAQSMAYNVPKTIPKAQFVAQHVVFAIYAAYTVNNEAKAAIYAFAIKFAVNQMKSLQGAEYTEIRRFLAETNHILGDFCVEGCKLARYAVVDAVHASFGEF